MTIKFVKTKVARRIYAMYSANKPAEYDIVKDGVVVGNIKGEFFIVTVLGAERGTQGYLDLPDYVVGCQGKFKYAKLAAVKYFSN